MYKLLLTILIGVLLASCAQQQKKENDENQEISNMSHLDSKVDSLSTTENNREVSQEIVERYFPDEKEITEFDTIIAERNLRITIQNRFLDSYVTNEFESEGKKYVDKYRDSEKHLVIILSNEIIVDTVFTKTDFEELTGRDFLTIANFHGYWFNEVQNNTIEFFGAISKPETDLSIAFYHFFTLR